MSLKLKSSRVVASLVPLFLASCQASIDGGYFSDAEEVILYPSGFELGMLDRHMRSDDRDFEIACHDSFTKSCYLKFVEDSRELLPADVSQNANMLSIRIKHILDLSIALGQRTWRTDGDHYKAYNLADGWAYIVRNVNAMEPDSYLLSENYFWNASERALIVFWRNRSLRNPDTGEVILSISNQSYLIFRIDY